MSSVTGDSLVTAYDLQEFSEIMDDNEQIAVGSDIPFELHYYESFLQL